MKKIVNARKSGLPRRAVGAIDYRVWAWAYGWTLLVCITFYSWLGWHPVLVFALGVVATSVATILGERRAIAWRLHYWRTRHDAKKPLVYNEDGEFIVPVLRPGEHLCVIEDDDRPLAAHIHTRTLWLGRPAIRSETEW